MTLVCRRVGYEAAGQQLQLVHVVSLCQIHLITAVYQQSIHFVGHTVTSYGDVILQSPNVALLFAKTKM